MDSRLKAIIAGTSLLILAFVGLFSARVPTLYCPFPVITVLPMFYSPPVGLMMPTILFFLWNHRLLYGQPNVPKRTMVAVAILCVLTAFWFKTSWGYGMECQGERYTVIMLIINLAWIASLWSLIILCLRRPSFRTNLLLHWVLFAWLSWYAFPWLGELP